MELHISDPLFLVTYLVYLPKLNSYRVLYKKNKCRVTQSICGIRHTLKKRDVIDCGDFRGDATGGKLLLSFSRTLRADRSPPPPPPRSHLTLATSASWLCIRLYCPVYFLSEDRINSVRIGTDAILWYRKYTYYEGRIEKFHLLSFSNNDRQFLL